MHCWHQLKSHLCLEIETLDALHELQLHSRTSAQHINEVSQQLPECCYLGLLQLSLRSHVVLSHQLQLVILQGTYPGLLNHGLIVHTLLHVLEITVSSPGGDPDIFFLFFLFISDGMTLLLFVTVSGKTWHVANFMNF